MVPLPSSIIPKLYIPKDGAIVGSSVVLFFFFCWSLFSVLSSQGARRKRTEERKEKREPNTELLVLLKLAPGREVLIASAAHTQQCAT